MKIEYGIHGKSRYALGFALAAGIALTATLIVHARPAEASQPLRCLPDEECPPPPVCEPGLNCGPIDDATIVGSFVRQKPNFECVYQCSGDQYCTLTVDDGHCTKTPVTNTLHWRVRTLYPWGLCPTDPAFAQWICKVGEPE
jgi:hypothetical protein